MFFLEDSRVGLRPLQEKDVDGGYKNWFNDCVVCQYNSHHRYVMSVEQLRSYIQDIQRDSSALVLAIEEKESHMHIGNISLQQINFIDRQAEIAFVIGEKQYWGKGYATQAAELLIEHGFKSLGLNRIYFGTAENNIGMQKVGEKLHFHRVGIRRQSLYKDGYFWDIYDYDLLREEWTGRGDDTL